MRTKEVTEDNAEHFATLFDSAFLPQGLALYRSLSRLSSEFRLWVVCVDNSAFEILSALNLDNLIPIEISRIETTELCKAKSGRTQGEYCWTLTPFLIKFVLGEIGDAARVTYVDADLWFRKSPKGVFSLFDESSAGVMITAHNYSPEHDRSELSGVYCVQFIIFKKHESEDILERWSRQCLEWCFNRHEDGRFGDQKYLDEWPGLYGDRVYVLEDKCAFLAPWNVDSQPYSQSVAYHFHGARVGDKGQLIVGGYKIPHIVIENIYRPYASDLSECIASLESVGFNIIAQIRRPLFGFSLYYGSMSIIRTIKRLLKEAVNQTIKIPNANG